jgi:PQQ-dependent catabolism-associated CXXCW motif protein
MNPAALTLFRRRVLLLAMGLTIAAADQAPPPTEPSGYRMEDYRAPVPTTLRGATILTTDQAHTLWTQRHAAFVDVLPRPPRPAGLPASTIWRPKPRSDIPGSLWLPDTGYGALAPVMQQYFEHGLTQASGGDHDRMLVFYCLANCWMSWNAARRAMTLGYTHVGWYPDGTDGWEAQGLPVEPREPLPRPSVSE